MGKKVTARTHMPHVEGLVTIHKNRVGHVDIKLESIGRYSIVGSITSEDVSRTFDWPFFFVKDI